MTSISPVQNQNHKAMHTILNHSSVNQSSIVAISLVHISFTIPQQVVFRTCLLWLTPLLFCLYFCFITMSQFFRHGVDVMFSFIIPKYDILKRLWCFNDWYFTFNMFPFYLKWHIMLWFLYWPAIAFGLCLFIPFSEIAFYNPVPCFTACSAAWETRRAFYYNYTTCWADSEDESAEVCFQCCWEMSYFWYSGATPDSDQWDAWHNWWKCAITGLFSTICLSC